MLNIMQTDYTQEADLVGANKPLQYTKGWLHEWECLETLFFRASGSHLLGPGRIPMMLADS